jgi:outer membrane protein OmpA-like peptidoglycan-associated protein
MRTRARWWIAAALSAAGCAAEKPATENAPAAAAPVAVPAAVVANANDPEPPDAQARAEAVVHADFNRDKTTKLTMNMTTIIGQTSTIEGFATNLAAREERIEDKLARLGAKVTETEVVIQLPGAILFDFDSAAIRPDAERALSDVARVIDAYAQRPVRIEGHTDSVAGDDYNQTLSERRAQSVAEWLAARGIAKSRLASAGYGEKKPVATNENAAGRQQNRRVEVIIAKK